MITLYIPYNGLCANKKNVCVHINIDFNTKTNELVTARFMCDTSQLWPLAYTIFDLRWKSIFMW